MLVPICGGWSTPPCASSTRSSLTYLNCWGTLAPGGGDGSIVTVSLLNFVQLKLCLDWDPSLKGFDLVVLVRVDNETFTFLGYDPTLTQVDLTSAVVSPTQIVLSAKAGHTDWVKQSIPLSYMSLTPKSLDDAAHSVQVYSDLSAVFSISRDPGTIQAMQDPIVWVVGYTTDPVIDYTDLSGTPQRRSSFYKVQSSDDFMNNFVNTSSRAMQLDQKTPCLSLDCLEIWFPSRPHKYTVALS